MKDLPLMCRIFGHKFVAVIGNFPNWASDTVHWIQLNEPTCKRCGVRLSDLQREIKK